jgi:hypothetical protein
MKCFWPWNHDWNKWESYILNVQDPFDFSFFNNEFSDKDLPKKESIYF